MNRSARLLGGVALPAALQLLSCGGSDLPECADNNCVLPGRTIVQWQFNHYPELLFPSDTCIDVGAVTVRTEIAGIDDPAFYDAKDVACGQGQVSYLDLAPGNYNVIITPLDALGVALVKAPVAMPAIAGTPGADTNVTINVPFESWTNAYTGTFLFRLSWGGVSCEVASVATQTLTLTAGGAVVTALTDNGQKLDGSDAKPCRPLTESFAQFAPQMPEVQPGLPFGPATLVVVGKSATDEVLFQRQFDTFVGAAKNNPTIVFDLPAPDAGVDAPPDAPPDTM
ncbi:MAG: hypothetical protein ABI867_28680 [Kofleriaceae bacterium]